MTTRAEQIAAEVYDETPLSGSYTLPEFRQRIVPLIAAALAAERRDALEAAAEMASFALIGTGYSVRARDAIRALATEEETK